MTFEVWKRELVGSNVPHSEVLVELELCPSSAAEAEPEKEHDQSKIDRVGFPGTAILPRTPMQRNNAPPVSGIPSKPSKPPVFVVEVDVEPDPLSD